MQIHNVVQGDPEWHTLRRGHRTASEAAAMMGASKRMSRDELLAMKKLGVEQEISRFTQMLFDNGHAAEAAIRPAIEDRMAMELFPCTGTDVVAGIPLLASFDGLSLDGSTAIEVKLWNKETVAAVKAGTVPDEHIWQLEQQALVAGLAGVHFYVTDGN